VPVRVTTAFNRLLALPGITVSDVSFGAGAVTVTVALRRRRLHCPRCDYSTRARHDSRPGASSWRGLDLGCWQVMVRAELRRLECPTHGVLTEGVPFPRSGARFTEVVPGLVEIEVAVPRS